MPHGQLTTRTVTSNSIARVTGYSYDAAGSLTNIAYPAGVPPIRATYDKLRRITTMTDALGTTAFTYSALGFMDSETPPWGESSRLTNLFNNLGLRSQLQLQQPAGSWTQGFRYDSSGRLWSITNSAISATTPFTYTYRGAGRLVNRITFPTGGRIEDRRAICGLHLRRQRPAQERHRLRFSRPGVSSLVCSLGS
jgi:YD repeat-containing protein